MPSYLLDSDVIIEYFRGNPKTVSLLANLGPKSRLCTSVLSVVEVKSGTRLNVEGKIENFFNSIKTVDVNLEIADLAAYYMKECKKKGKILYLVDAIIAATCVIYDFTLVTYNKRDYPMKELKVISS